MKAKLNILHITFDMEIGGAEQVIRNLVEQGDKLRFNFFTLCISGKIGAIGQQMQNDGHQIIAFERKQGLDWSLIKRIRHYVKTHHIDVIHCHQYTPYFYGVVAVLFNKVRVVFTEHGRFYPDTFKIKRWLFNPLLSLCTDQIIAISQATLNALVKYENFPKSKIIKIYNGIEYSHAPMSEEQLNDLKRLIGIEPTAFVLGSISRLDGIKNQALMIRSLAALRKQNKKINLLLVGDGPELLKLQQLSKELEVLPYVFFVGNKLYPNPYLQLMDVFLLTSFSEGTSMTLLEAMACGKAVIVTNVGGNPEVVIDNETGLVIENDNLDALNEAINKFMVNEDLKNNCAFNAQQRFRRVFKVNNMNRAYQNLYLLKKSG